MFSEASTSAYFDVISMHESQLSIDVIVFVDRYSGFTGGQQGCKGSPKRHAAKQTQSLSWALRTKHRNRRCSPSFQTPPPNARKQQ